MDELLSLKWSNHSPTFLSALAGLREKQCFVDVTLACGEKFYNVHKIVLSACSEYFGNIFDHTDCKQPVIVLNDVKSRDLESLLDYMYLGEVNVQQTDLATLIKAAESLRVKGLAVPDEETSCITSTKKRRNHFENQSKRHKDYKSPPPKRIRRVNSKDRNESKELRLSTTPQSYSQELPQANCNNGSFDQVKTEDDETTMELCTIKAENNDFSEANDLASESMISDHILEDNYTAVSDWAAEGNTPSASHSHKSVHHTKNNQSTNRTTGGRLLYELSDNLQGASSSSQNLSTFNKLCPETRNIEEVITTSNSFTSMPIDNNSLSGHEYLHSGGDERLQPLEGDLSSLSDILFHSGDPNLLQKGLISDAIAQDNNTDSSMKCPYCTKVFNYQSKLERHIRAHTNERPFQCKYCPYSAKHRDNLKTHCYLKHEALMMEEEQHVSVPSTEQHKKISSE